MNLTTSSKRIATSLVFLLVASMATAQAWQEAYDQALSAAKNGQWIAAREAFQQAAASRMEDQAKPTQLPGPITEPRRWRNGAPYSPNFGAAYAAYQMALATKDDAEQKSLLKLAADELNILISKNQKSPEAISILEKIHNKAGDKDAAKAAKALKSNDWKVDTAFLKSGDIIKRTTTNSGGATIITPGNGKGSATVSQGKSGVTMIKIKAGNETDTANLLESIEVPKLDNKFALVIGNSTTQITDLAVPFGASDATSFSNALINFAGYMPENVVTLTNVTGVQIKEAVEALTERIPNNATVMFYFSGVGVHVDGRDLYAGTDSEFATDVAGMVPKTDIQRSFLSKGARLFMFNQMQRNGIGNNYFGQERAIIGSISEAHATIQGQAVYSTTVEGEKRGLYTNGMIQVLSEFRTNAVPVTEFCWQVYSRIRRGASNLGGGGSYQTPTLPTVTNMSDDARF